jgi:hypothetical protein
MLIYMPVFFIFAFFRWGLVIHGDIDGYSRLITFLTAASNNKSATMMESFLGGTTKYGVPSRVGKH